ncbi:MAG: 30S ribosomal protein S5 [Candidatus Bipolaricaulia bacterium]
MMTEQFDNQVIEIRRVSKVVKGGRNIGFRTTVVVGDREGQVGVGSGNTNEIPKAIQQGIRDAQKHLITVPLVSGTIPHEVVGEFETGKVILKPAYEGTGVIAGKTVGAICKLVGIRNILTKSLGSSNPLTLAKATIEGLKRLRNVDEVAALRNKDPEEILGERPSETPSPQNTEDSA